MNNIDFRQEPVTQNGYRWKGLIALLLGTFSVVLSMSFLFPATPIIMKDLGVGIDLVTWLSLAYALSAGVFEPIFGKLGDIFGRKRNVVIGLTIFTVAQVIAALSPNIWIMAVARFIQGLGAAAVIPVGMAFVGENFPGNERGKALGIWGMITAGAPAIGPTLGGYLIDWFGWRSIYWTSALLGIASLIVIVFVVHETRKHLAQKLDFLGSGLLFLMMGSLLVAVNQGRNWGWVSPLTVGFFISSFVNAVLFIWYEKKVPSPVIDLEFIKTPLFVFASITVFVSFLVFQGAFFLIPFFLQQVQHYPASQTGQLVIPLFLALMISSLISGRLTDKIGVRIPAVFGMLTTMFALYLLSLVQVDTSYWSLATIMGVLGIGIGATLPPMSKTVASSAPLPKIGAAVGAFNMVRNLGGPFGVAIAATIFANKVAEYSKSIFAEQVRSLGLSRNQLVGQQLIQLQEYAKAHGMQQSFAEVSLTLLFVSVLGLITAFLVKAKARSEEDLLRLQQFKDSQAGIGKPLLQEIPKN